MIQTSNQIGVAILKALGISVDHCFSATIKIRADEPVSVEAEYWATENEHTNELIDEVAKLESKAFVMVPADGCGKQKKE